jgi:glycosyltransferase involved in cell wall biosynthesis
VPHGLAPEFLANDPGDDAPRGKGLLFCGSWDLVKGTPYLVRAFEQMNEAGAGCTLTILGPGLPASDVLQAFKPSVRQLIHVIDRAGEDVVRRAYRDHDVLLWPSTYEGFGLVLIEAMSQRMAVVATPAGCASALVRDGVNGVVVPPRDPAALAGAAARLIANHAERRRLGRAAREAVIGMSWQACAEQTIRCYRTAIENRQ